MVPQILCKHRGPPEEYTRKELAIQVTVNRIADFRVERVVAIAGKLRRKEPKYILGSEPLIKPVSGNANDAMMETGCLYFRILFAIDKAGTFGAAIRIIRNRDKLKLQLHQEVKKVNANNHNLFGQGQELTLF